jgi:phosphoribosyl 1,2-cyclic phosphodiesterase
MKLTFLGTRGNIIARSKKHTRHTVTAVAEKNTRILLDCGEDWLLHHKQFPKPRAIFLTHGHPDHAFGLRNGAPCPIYATTETWKIVDRFAIDTDLRHLVKPYTPIQIGSLLVEAFPVHHSLHAPAVGYRITAERKNIFYAPDLTRIIKQRKALKNVQVYVGDGAIISRYLLVRPKDGEITGQTAGNPEVVEEKLRVLSKEYSMRITLAHDGMARMIRKTRAERVAIS